MSLMEEFWIWFDHNNFTFKNAFSFSCSPVTFTRHFSTIVRLTFIYVSGASKETSDLLTTYWNCIDSAAKCGRFFLSVSICKAETHQPDDWAFGLLGSHRANLLLDHVTLFNHICFADSASARKCTLTVLWLALANQCTIKEIELTKVREPTNSSGHTPHSLTIVSSLELAKKCSF